MAALEQQKLASVDAAKMAEITAAIDAEKKAAEPVLKEAKAKMPQPIFPLKNPGVYSLAAAFVVGILASLLAPDREAEKRFEGEKLREYIGIGAED